MKAKDWLKSKDEVKCSKCGRLSIGHKKGEVDNMPQPNGKNCGGVFL